MGVPSRRLRGCRGSPPPLRRPESPRAVHTPREACHPLPQPRACPAARSPPGRGSPSPRRAGARLSGRQTVSSPGHPGSPCFPVRTGGISRQSQVQDAPSISTALLGEAAPPAPSLASWGLQEFPLSPGYPGTGSLSPGPGPRLLLPTLSLHMPPMMLFQPTGRKTLPCKTPLQPGFSGVAYLGAHASRSGWLPGTERRQKRTSIPR